MQVLQDTVADRKVIGRVDRTELSKNVWRGLLAYRELLRTRPEWRGRVVHAVFNNPSREDLPAYREYTARIERLAADIDDEFSTDEWTPIIFEISDDYPAGLAIMRRSDVILINPVRDGMNLVVLEAVSAVRPVARGGALARGRRCRGARRRRDHVNPFDVSATADALHEALTMPRRRARAPRRADARGGRPAAARAVVPGPARRAGSHMSLPFPEPTEPRDSRTAVFLGYLDYFRSTLVAKLRELPPDDQSRAAGCPLAGRRSNWSNTSPTSSCAGSSGASRAPTSTIHGATGAMTGGIVAGDEDLAALVSALHARATITRAIVERHDLEEVGQPGPRWDGEPPPTLERILFHLLQEYARHVGSTRHRRGAGRRSRGGVARSIPPPRAAPPQQPRGRRR